MFQMGVQSLYYANTFSRVFRGQMLRQQNTHHMHTLVCEVFEWNHEQHLYTYTFIPIVNRFASLIVPL